MASDDAKGLRAPRQLIVDKITTIPKTRMGVRIGRLTEEQMVQLNRAVVVFLGIGGAG